MTRRDDRDGDDGAGPDEDRPRSLIRSLLDLLREMEERGEHTRTGHSRPGPRTSVDYSVSIGGLGGPDESRPSAGDERTPGRADRSEESTSEALVTTRETPGGLIVAADLPGVDDTDVESRLDPEASELVIEVAGRDEARLPLDSNGWTVVDSRFANGVLEVELRRD